MTLVPLLFFLFSVVAIASAIVVVVHRNPVYSALFLILTLFALAGHFVLLNAPFIATAHIIVYTGAIMVLFLFVILLLDLKSEQRQTKSKRGYQIAGIFLAIILLAEIGVILKSGQSPSPTASTLSAISRVGNTKAIGELLFTKYLFAFEVASVLLLSAIIGAIVLAKSKLR
ncbi:MAG: NADH-quinone oxidoreductase subunit J [bacterium]